VLDMTTDTMAMLSMLTALRAIAGRKEDAVVPEPEFVPFRLSRRGGAAGRAERPAAANTTRAPRTLEELGVPAPLARELEAALDALGLTKGDRITGFTFRAPDGASYALRTTPVKAPRAGDLAA
jgi:hypothetical protein